MEIEISKMKIKAAEEAKAKRQKEDIEAG